MDILGVIIGLIVGGSIVFLVFSKLNMSKGNSILEEAKKEAEQIKKTKILQAKERFLELKSEHEKSY